MRKFVIALVTISICALTYNQYCLQEDKTSEENVTEESTTTSEETVTDESISTSEEIYPISLQISDDYTMNASSPYIVLYANGQAFTEDVNDFIEAYNSTPKWLKNYCTELYLESDENYRISTQQYEGAFDNSVGFAHSDGQGNRLVYIKLRYRNENGKPILNSNLSYEEVLVHELSHQYDFYHRIVQTYDTSILENNVAGVCSVTGSSNCSDNLKETFANAMTLYIINPEALPSDLKAWIDSLPL